MNIPDKELKKMTNKEIKTILEEEYADMYCCSPECLELPYIDATV